MGLEQEKFLIIVYTIDKQHNMAGRPFPELEGKTLSGREIVFPGSVEGLVTFLVIAFVRQAQDQVDSWVEPFVSAFGDWEGCGFFEVPMLGAYIDALHVKDRSLCHCFLIDRSGVIRWTGKGFADEKRLEKMRETVETLLNAMHDEHDKAKGGGRW